MKIELAKNSCGQINASVQAIENLAYGGMFTAENKHSQFYRIVEETRKLKQILLDALVFVPPGAAPDNGGNAA